MEWRSESRMDWNAWIRAALLLALTGFLVRLIVTGDIRWYVNPKFTTFTASAGIGLVLMAAGQIARALRGRPGGAPVRTRLYLSVAAVLATGFLMRPVIFASDLAAKQGLNITKRAGAQAPAVPPAAVTTPEVTPPAVTTPAGAGATPAPGQAAPAAPAGGAGSTSGTGSPPSPGAPAPGAPAPGKAPAQPARGGTGLINITPDNWVTWMTDFYGPNPAQFAGRRVTMEGFIFHAPEVKPDEFAVTRLVVTCHVAHAYPDGLLTVWPGHARPAQDAWVRVEGVLEPVVHQGVSTLRIKADKLVEVPKPSDPYVYP